MDFEQLYTTYFRKVYGFALSLSRNAHMAEEITQETFYRVLRNPDAFEGRSSVDTYLCSIAHHQYVSMLRRQKHIDFRTDTAQLSAPGGMEEALADRDAARQLYLLLLLYHRSRCLSFLHLPVNRMLLCCYLMKSHSLPEVLLKVLPSVTG